MELKERHGDESSNKIKMSRSLYVRMMICYRGLIVLADQTDECKQMLLFFKKVGYIKLHRPNCLAFTCVYLFYHAIHFVLVYIPFS